MASDSAQPLEAGDLTVDSETGEVRNSLGKTVRLGPVNMRILALLASRTGEVVSRKELFEAAWKNQTVSDDALTRCISDSRAALGEISDDRQVIETLPKRGYRWNTGGAERLSTPALGNGQQRQPARQRETVASLRKGLMYLIAFGVLASVSPWLIDRLARPATQIVVLMPVESGPTERALAARIERQLSEFLLELDQVELLSRTAVGTRPNNPVPYFYYEFGARWLIESELLIETDESVLSIVLVDARAGIVLLQLAKRMSGRDGLTDVEFEETVEPLRAYIYSQHER